MQSIMVRALVHRDSSHGTVSSTGQALCKVNVSRPEILILDCITDLRDKYIFPLVNVLSFYQMASEADSWAGHRALPSPALPRPFRNLDIYVQQCCR